LYSRARPLALTGGRGTGVATGGATLLAWTFKATTAEETSRMAFHCMGFNHGKLGKFGYNMMLSCESSKKSSWEILELNN
jgi:hypothetical protein